MSKREAEDIYAVGREVGIPRGEVHWGLAALVLDARAEAATLREYLAEPNKALDEVARDNDRLRAEVERLTKERDEARELRKLAMGERDEAVMERDAAQSVLADVTATLSGEFNTRISAARLDGAIGALEWASDVTEWPECIDRRIAELKAERSKL